MRASAITKSVITHASDGTQMLAHQGGSSSGKTYGILQGIALLIVKYGVQGVFSIVAPTIPHLKKGVLRDWQAIQKEAGWDGLWKVNLTDRTYEYNGAVVEFFSAVDDMGRGGKRDFLFCNEVNLWNKQTFTDLFLRTRRLTIIDYNPSAKFWFHEEYQGKQGVKFYISTIDHNPAADDPDLQAIKRKLDALKHTDPEAYRVYRLGLSGSTSGVIFSPRYCDAMPSDFKRRAFGMDFGYVNDPTTLVELSLNTGQLWLKQHIYETGLLNSDIISRLRGLEAAKVLTRQDIIIADAADPKAIEEIKRAGYNIRPAAKGKDSVVNGIDRLKRYPINITHDSPDLKREAMNYKWQERDGKPTNTPIDNFNHGWDAARYAAEWVTSDKRSGVVSVGGSRVV